MTDEQGPLKPGDLLARRYEIVRLLGAGGMGWVYEARDQQLGERIAVKVLKGASRDTEAHHRFVQEVKLARRVRHKNVAAIHDYGEDGDIRFITMAFVPGRDLRHRIGETGGLPWEEGYQVGLQIGAGLEAAHDEGVIHRDLKPGNVMVEPSGHVRVMDFGVAKAREGGQPGFTRPDIAIGTPEYMSPEQIQAAEIDPRSDLYALGIVLYEIFTGDVPFRGDNVPAVMIKHIHDPPPFDSERHSAVRRLPRSLVPVLRRALAKDPADRFSSCREMLKALNAARLAQATDPLPPIDRPSGEEETRGIPAPSPRSIAALPPEARLLVPMLIQALKHGQSEVRIGAARALALHGPAAEPAATVLRELLADPEVKEIAAEALRAIVPDAPPEPADPRDDDFVPPPVSDPADPVRAGPPMDQPPPPSPSPPGGLEPAPPLPPQPPPRKPLDDATPVDPRSRPPRRPFPPEPDPLASPGRAWAIMAALLLATALLAAWLLIPRREPAPPSQPIPVVSSGPTAPPSLPAETVPPLPSPTATPEAPVVTAPPTTMRRQAPATTVAVTLPPSTTTTTEPPAPVATTTTSTTSTTSTTTTTLPAFTPSSCRMGQIEYPAIALQRRQEGTVLLRVLVDESGRVAEVRIVRAVELLTETAVNAVRAAACTPARRGDVPVKEWVEIPIRFELPK